MPPLHCKISWAAGGEDSSDFKVKTECTENGWEQVGGLGFLNTKIQE